jgi:hypothetical protein
MVLALVEFRTYFVERAVGSFLNLRNRGREAWGRTWEQQQNIRQATRKIDEQNIEAGELRVQIEAASSFKELFSALVENHNLPLSPAKFVDLYAQLPDILKKDLIDPGELLNLYWGGVWVRTTIILQGDVISAYLVDERNRVIRSLKISRALVNAAQVNGVKAEGALADAPGFGGSVYPSNKFFNIFWSLPDSERIAIISDPDILLQLPKPIMKVGFGVIPDANGYTAIGFETESSGIFSHITYPVHTAALANLRWKLALEDSDTLFKKDVDVDADGETMHHEVDASKNREKPW